MNELVAVLDAVQQTDPDNASIWIAIVLVSAAFLLVVAILISVMWWLSSALVNGRIVSAQTLEAYKEQHENSRNEDARRIEAMIAEQQRNATALINAVMDYVEKTTATQNDHNDHLLEDFKQTVESLSKTQVANYEAQYNAIKRILTEERAYNHDGLQRTIKEVISSIVPEITTSITREIARGKNL